MENKMRDILVEKITLNIGVGEPGERLEKIKALLEQISGAKVVKTETKRRIPEWGLRPGLEIGVKTTLRGEKAEEVLKRMFTAVENTIPASKFDRNGNLSFGVKEYIHIPGAKYDYTIGIVGISVNVTLFRRGFSISRKRNKSSIGKSHLIKKEEAEDFIKNKYNVKVI
ncbi:MAG: ribosomal protein L5 [Candidatus Parvarchaeum acidophilus ARMAN-5]|jgi:large subunit ribosomal protein L5|uniref:Ribosomal protein L5 n=1 Tax=Candidatus Parvarchaeum acidophilus ARMAN-5 TaxID=662762 RepID=D6GWY6_PARA5|nr:MAG: ribosomal protein L5 [Candidatus Parvarchaeum acidophilus ARMAN-5]